MSYYLDANGTDGIDPSKIDRVYPDGSRIPLSEPEPEGINADWDKLKNWLYSGWFLELYAINSMPGFEPVKAAFSWLTDTLVAENYESFKLALSHPSMGLVSRLYVAGEGMNLADGEELNSFLAEYGFFQLSFEIDAKDKIRKANLK